MGRSIIAAVDGSPEATHAAGVAARYARALDRRLVLAFIAEDPRVFPYGESREREVARRHAIADGGAVLRAVAADLGLQDARRRIALAGDIYGTVAERLAGLAIEEDADFVVTRAHARQLADICPCPVMVAGLHTSTHWPEPNGARPSRHGTPAPSAERTSRGRRATQRSRGADPRGRSAGTPRPARGSAP